MNLTFGEFNHKISQERLRQYARNGAENYQRIRAEFQRADYSMDTLPQFVPGQGPKALVLGSGPSLDDALPFVKDFEGLIFASPSQLDLLEKWEITPHFVVSVDSADSVGEDQIRADRDTYGMTLLAHPYLSPKTLDAWKGNKRYFQLIADDDHFHDVYPWIKVGFPIAGSVNNTEVLMARWMGLSPIVLAGVDYCFPDGRIRAQDYRRRGPYIFDPLPHQYVQTEEGLTTATQETLFYANILLGLWKMYRLPLIQVGDKGACTEIPFVQPEDMNKIIEVGGPSDAQVAAIDAAMTSYGMFAEVDDLGVGHFSYAEVAYQDMKDLEDKLSLAEAEAFRWTQAGDEWKHR